MNIKKEYLILGALGGAFIGSLIYRKITKPNLTDNGNSWTKKAGATPAAAAPKVFYTKKELTLAPSLAFSPYWATSEQTTVKGGQSS